MIGVSLNKKGKEGCRSGSSLTNPNLLWAFDITGWIESKLDSIIWFSCTLSLLSV